jgi:hypothetical protein
MRIVYESNSPIDANYKYCKKREIMIVYVIHEQGNNFSRALSTLSETRLQGIP